MSNIKFSKLELSRIATCVTAYLRENSMRLAGTAYGESLESILNRIEKKLNEQ